MKCTLLMPMNRLGGFGGAEDGYDEIKQWLERVSNSGYSTDTCGFEDGPGEMFKTSSGVTAGVARAS